MELVAKSSKDLPCPARSRYKMPDPHSIPSAAGRVTTITVFTIFMVAIGLTVAGSLAILRHSGLPLETILPGKNTTSQPPSLQNTHEKAGEITLKKEPNLNINTVPENIPATEKDLLPVTGDSAPEVLELIEVARALRKDGDTVGALNKLREADRHIPANPRILWELSITYNAMALEKKAQEKLARLVQLGPEKGGEYYQIAKLSVDADTPIQTAGEPSDFSYGRIMTSTQPDEGNGEHVLVRMAIHSRLGYAVAPEDIAILIEFYDLVDGTKVAKTRSNTPTSHWPTQPVNWTEPATEIIEWQYHMPVLTPREIADFGKRKYYGFIARLYHKNKLQDVYAEPRILLAQPPNEAIPLLDDSLFPDSD